MTAASPTDVVDASDVSFDEEVIAESRRRPVVVDFWAAWCGPCRVLGPVLERLAVEARGAFRLAKVDVDANPAVSQLHGVRSIPLVKAFRDGRVIDEFVGALPEGDVRRWLESFVPGPADEAAERGDARTAAGDAAGARAAFEEALSIRPRHGRSLLGLAGLDLREGRPEEAERRLDLVAAGDAERLAKEIGALRLAIRAGGTSADELRARLDRDPEDDAARVELGQSLAAGGRHEEALSELLEVVKRRHREGAGEDARRAMLEIFEAVGARSELADRFRSLLAAELYR